MELAKQKIPSTWQKLRLGDCLTIKHGKSQKEIEVVDGKYPILASGGVIGRTNTPLYSKPSVLIGRKGTIDKPRYMDTPFWTVDTLFYSQVKDNSVPKYLFYVFNFIDWYEYNEASGVPSLSSSTISSIEVLLPPLPEQNRIVSVLETWDKAIEKLSRKIEIKKEIKRGLMRGLLTGKLRVTGRGGSWDVYKIGDIIVESRIPSKSFDVTKRISVRLNMNGVESREVRGTEAEGSTMFFVRSAGQFVYGKQNLYKGAMGIIPEQLNGYESTQDIPSFDFREGFDSKWFLYFMGRESFYSQLEDIATGSGSKRIHPRDLFKIKIRVPKYDEQLAIASVLSVADSEIRILTQKQQCLERQKKFLLNNLVTGKIRTPENLQYAK